MSDLRNNRLTLPIWYCLKYGTEKQKKTLLRLVGDMHPVRNQQSEALHVVKKCGAFDFVLKEANKIKNGCRKWVRTLPKSKYRDLFSIMISIVRRNKFYATLRELSN